MFNIRSVDLNLLPVFEAVYEERSLSRAAVRLAMTQSAVSHAVSRLRLVLRDELFVRHSRGVVPTPAADAIYSRLHDALGSVRDAVTETRGFNARTSVRKFFLSIAHPLGPIILLRLQERLAGVAPNISVSASTRSRPIDLGRALRDGRIDAAIDWLEPQGEPFKSAGLFDDAVIAVARNGHPALRKATSMQVLHEGRFVTLRPRVEGEHPVAALLEWQRMNLRVALEVSDREVRCGAESIRVRRAGDEDPVRTAVESHLRDLAAAELTPRALALAADCRVSVAKIAVRNQRSRWGACSSQGTITLNWRLIQMPPSVSDYVIFHELMHRRQPNHSRKFWREVESVCTWWKEAERWLRKHGREIL